MVQGHLTAEELVQIPAGASQRGACTFSSCLHGFVLGSETCILGCGCECERGCLIASVCQLCDRLTTWLVHAPPLAGVRFINPKSSKLQQHVTILTMLEITLRDFRHNIHV